MGLLNDFALEYAWTSINAATITKAYAPPGWLSGERIGFMSWWF